MATDSARSAQGADAATPETQAAAAGDGFVTYDELRGPDLDAARWSPARLPLPTGDEHVPLDPNAELAVGEGEVRVTIPRFSLSHDTVPGRRQPQVPHLLDAPVPAAAGSARDLRRRPRGREHRRGPGGLPSGHGRLPRVRPRVSKRVFAVIGTSTRVFALHEQLGLGGAGEPFYHVVESPYEDFDDDFTRLRACEITLDRSRSTAAWRVDGHTVYETHGTLIPERVRIGFGIWTMLPIRDGRSRSLDGQGMNARWRRFRVRGVDASRHQGRPAVLTGAALGLGHQSARHPFGAGVVARRGLRGRQPAAVERGGEDVVSTWWSWRPPPPWPSCSPRPDATTNHQLPDAHDPDRTPQPQEAA